MDIFTLDTLEVNFSAHTVKVDGIEYPDPVTILEKCHAALTEHTPLGIRDHITGMHL